MAIPLDPFRDWLIANASITNNIHVSSTPHAGYGLFTSSVPIPLSDPPKPLAFIPSHLLVTASRVFQHARDHEQKLLQCLESLQSTDNETPMELTERLIVLLFLVYERHVRTKSHSASSWKSYIDILPTPASLENHPLFYTPELLSLLTNTRLHDAVSAKRTRLQREIEWLAPHVEAAGWALQLDLEIWTWTDAVFWSRVVSMESQFAEEKNVEHVRQQPSEDYHLIPFVDFANHSLTPNVRWHLRGDGSGIDLLPILPLTISADNPAVLPPNTELCLSYGAKPNQELLYLHGFCIPENPTPPALVIPALPFFNPANGFDRRKLAWLRHCGMSLTLTFDPDNPNAEEWAGGLAPESVVAMYIAVLTEEPEDGLEFRMEEDADGHPILLLMLSDVTVGPTDAVSAFAHEVRGLQHYDVVRLRVVAMLLDALDWHLARVTSVEEGEREGEDQFETRATRVLEGTDEARHDVVSRVVDDVRTYRKDEERVISETVSRLAGVRDELMESKVVKRYLRERQEEEEGGEGL
ncbi:hypothetical protein BC938DRAFT_479916 [Jimgerdemannia flammicorona]|uniref:SET domain-containing protein n=1 Tax=Jimgerdemannia flammicorona TaxID=994334 RepID=A0A433QJW2_9FUNG|nr:hypothetical protein BC938DRAFT_479916 [Jimgerdemannia flammicorona]